MEPVTQALLGAATAELVAGKALRGRALGWGALIGMSPDLDVLLSPLQNGYGEWIYHRGTTHSLWFGFVIGPLLGWMLWRWRDPERKTPLAAWIGIGVAALVTHPLLDGFTPYGTQFFAPFLRDRFAWNGVAIVDPFYSLVLGLGVWLAARKNRPERTRRIGLMAGVALSTLYLIAGLGVNRWVESDLRQAIAMAALSNEPERIERIRAYPTIFQPWLRSFVVRTKDTTYVGLHSWQEAGCPAWRVYPDPVESPAVRALRSSHEAEILEWFADGDVGLFIHREPGGVERLRMEDLRYSWADANARGMWGLEARFGPEGELLGPIRRFPRNEPRAEDFARIARLLQGELPRAGGGWIRPSGCEPPLASVSARHD